MAPKARSAKPQRGATLIELVIAVVIVTIAVSAVLGVLTINAKQSADAMMREQAIAIANAYLEEILLKSYDDPDTTGEASRELFDDVSDYHGLNDTSGARDQLGNSISGLDQYRVQVAVTAETLSGVTAKRIDVTVTTAAAIQSGHSALAIKLTGYRTNY